MTIGAGLLDITGKPALLSATDDVVVGSTAAGRGLRTIGLKGDVSVPNAGVVGPDIASASTITPTAGIMRFTPVGVTTGLIMAAGSFDGQEVTIVNEATATNTMAFNATPATARVALPFTLGVATCCKLVWDSARTLWFKVV